MEAVGSREKEVIRLVAGFHRWEEAVEAFKMTAAAAESCYQMEAEDSTGCCWEAVEVEELGKKTAVEAAMTLVEKVAGCLREEEEEEVAAAAEEDSMKVEVEGLEAVSLLRSVVVVVAAE